MKKTRWARRSAVVAAGAAMALTVSGAPATASAQTFWVFQNLARPSLCISGAESGNVWAGACTGEAYQQWDFLSSSGVQSRIMNRETGTCLTTDNRSGTNAVWLAPCDEANQQWHWEADDGSMRSMAFGTYLRSSPANQSIVTSVPDGDPATAYYQWFGIH